MKNQSNRPMRMSAKIQTAVSEILLNEYSDDPLIRDVSLSGFKSGGGVRFVQLFYHLREPSKRADTQKRLNTITPTVRMSLAKKIDQKYVPEIRFDYDDTLEKSARIEDLLKECLP